MKSYFLSEKLKIISVLEVLHKLQRNFAVEFSSVNIYLETCSEL